MAAHILFGKAFDEVSIEGGRGLGDSFRESAGSWVTPGMPIDAGVRQRIEEETMRIYSGPLAEDRGSGGGGHQLSTDDHEAVMRLALVATEGDEEEATAYAEWLSVRALRLMNRFDVWPAVRALAEELMRAGSLTYEEARTVIERSRGEVHVRDMQDHPVMDQPRTD